MIKLSIIIPVYNVEKYLEKSLNSVLGQKYKNYEIILIDDGSTDKSIELCDKYSAEYKNIKVIHKKNEGLSEARNVGIKLAQGEYIVFLDSDDWIFKNGFTSIDNIIQDEEPDIIINRMASYFEDNNKIVECEYKFNLNDMKRRSVCEVFDICYDMKGFWGTAWIIVIKRKYLLENNLFFWKGILHEDEEWTPKVILNAKKISFNNDILYCNRREREGSITQVKNIKKEFDKILIIDKLFKESNLKIYDKAKKNRLRSRCSRLYMGILKNSKCYKNQLNEYIMLLDKLDNRYYVLKFNKKLRYKIIHSLIKMLGVKKINEIL